MEKTFKRLLSFAVALVMILGMIPVTQIEAKAAETVSTETGDTTNTVDDTYTKNLEWVTEPGEDGTGGTAVCPACGGDPVEWVPVDENFQGHGHSADAAVKEGNYHYYVPDQADGSKGTIVNTTVAKSSFFLYVSYSSADNTESTFCLHLNDNNLEFNGVIWLAGGNFNLMGNGELKGNYSMTTVESQPYRGSTINNHSGSSVVRLYSGTVASGTGNPAYGMSALGGAGSNYMYKDAKVEGIRMVSGTFNMEGGEVVGPIHMEPVYRSDSSRTTTSLKFNMKSGKITGGSADNGGSVLMAGIDNEKVTVSLTFTMDDGIIEGGNVTGYGGNVYMRAGTKNTVTFNMNGGVIRNGVAGKNGGNVYISGKDANKKANFTMKNDAELIGGKAEIGGNLYVNSYSNVTIEKDAKLTQKLWEEGDALICSTGGANLGMAGQSAVVNVYGTLTGGYAKNGGNIYSTSCTLNIHEGALITGGRSVGSGGNIYSAGAPGSAKADDNGYWKITTTTAVINVSGTIENGCSETANGGNVASPRVNFTLNKTGKISGGKAEAAGGNLYLTGIWTGDGTEADPEDHLASTIYIYGTVENGTAGSSGGNLYVGTAGSTTIDGATFTGGQADTNGGNVSFGSSSGSPVKILNSSFTDGVAGSSGGNLYLNNRNYTFSGNTVTGGISNHVPGDTNSKSVEEGGDGKKEEWGSTAGGGNIYVTKAHLTITDSTISGGKSAGGGNIFLYNTATSLTLGEGALVTGGTSVKNINTYYRGGNIQASTGVTVNVNKGAVVSGGITENSRSGVDIVMLWKNTALNINGGTVGLRTNTNTVIYIDASKTSYYSAVNVNDGTVYGRMGRNANDYTSINIYHGTFSVDPTTNCEEGTKVVSVDGLYQVHKDEELTQTVVNPTCTEGGYTMNACSHTYTVGETTYTCEGYKTDLTEAKNHTFTKEDTADSYKATDADHKNAATYYYSCVDCGVAGTETFSYGDPVPHEFKDVVADEFLATPADHKNAATYFKSCECGEKSEETFSNGDPVAHEFKDVVADDFLATPADHKNAATYFKSCECGEKSTETFVSGDPVPHEFKEVVADDFLATPADHKNAATYYKSCECGEKSEETFSNGDPVAHEFKDVVADDFLATPADHKNAATYFKSCECGEKSTETFVSGDPVPHEFKDVVADDFLATPADHKNAATYFKSCECGEKSTETFVSGDPVPHEFKEVVSEETLKAPATCTELAVYYKSCECGEKSEETFTYGELAAHTLEAVPAKPATATEEGYEAHYACSCGALFADEKGEEPIEAPAVIAKLPVAAEVPEVEDIVGEDEQVLTEEQKEIVQQIIAQSEQIKKAENLPENTYLKISLSSAKVDGEKVTRVTYKVKPIVNGQEESNPGKKITFYLPVPKDVVKETVAVFHNGVLMGDDFVVQTEGEEKFVIVESDNFSEFTIDVNYVVNAMVGETPYGTLEEALEAAYENNGGVVVLEKPVSVAGLDVPANVTLDLNGQVLTVTGEGYVRVTFNESYIMDSSENKAGRLAVDVSRLRLMNTNKYLPVDMGNGIMFVEAVSGQGKNYEADSVYQCWMGDDTDVALMEALKTTDASVLGLKFQVIVSWGTTQLKYTFSNATVKAYAQDWTKLAMYLKLVGAEGIDDLTYQARIVFAEGTEAEVLVWSGAEIPHHSN